MTIRAVLPAPDRAQLRRERAAASAAAVRHQRRRLEVELDRLRAIRNEVQAQSLGSLPSLLTEAIGLLEAGQAKLRAAASWLDQRAGDGQLRIGREGAPDGD